jgi:hypothetical protein
MNLKASRAEQYLEDAKDYCEDAREAMDEAGITLADIRDTCDFYLPELISICRQLMKKLDVNYVDKIFKDAAPDHVWRNEK